jgi:hypothetical protein
MKSNNILKTFIKGFCLMLVPVFIALFYGCPSSPTTCNLPPPQTVTLDSFKAGKAYLRWSPVQGSAGYNIKVATVSQPNTPVRDTSVAANSTSIVIPNLPTNTLLQFTVFTECPNGLISRGSDPVISPSVTIADETMIKRLPCDRGFSRCLPLIAPVSTNTQTGVSCAIRPFIQSPLKQYHITVYDRTTLVSSFKMYIGASIVAPNPIDYFIYPNCGKNWPTGFGSTDTNIAWSASGFALRMVIDNATNTVTLSEDSGRSLTYTVKSATTYDPNCRKNGID